MVEDLSHLTPSFVWCAVGPLCEFCVSHDGVCRILPAGVNIYDTK